MKSLLRALTFCAAVAVPMAGLAAEHEVKMLNQGADGIMVFEPGYLKVNPGDTVTFVPANPGHDSVSDAIPDGAKGWKGQINQPVKVTLDKEGVYLYKCTPHLALGMVGVIQVGKPVNKDQVETAAKTLSASIVTNKERLQKYLSQVE
jgi:pseudoazurin